MMSWIRRRTRDDRGVAVVAAMGVAIVGVMLTTLVVSQVIIVTNDASRDRIRTSEIHSAEGALDAALKEMERELLCVPSFSPIQVGNGTNAVTVEVVIEYYAEDGTELTGCSPTGHVVGLPAEAIVTAQGTNNHEVMGVQPVRSIQAHVRISPRQGLSIGTSIFADGNTQFTNNGEVFSTDPEHPAGVWIDSGNLECNSNFTLDGDVIVVQGGAYITNSCRVTGSLWARDYFRSDSGGGNQYRVAGDVEVRNGNFTVNNGMRFGRDIRVNGGIYGWGFRQTEIAGTVCANSVEFPPLGTPAGTYQPCTSFTDYAPRGFPSVTYDISDWDGFTEKSRTQFGLDVADGWVNLSSSKRNQYLSGNVCVLSGSLHNRPIHLTNQDSVYDLRTCSFETNSGVEIHIYADTAIFASRFQISNQFKFVSGDGGDHKIWFIIPDQSGMNGELRTSNQMRVEAPLSIFYYTPGSAYISNSQQIRGQIYGKNLFISNAFELAYVPMGIPGVDLGGGLEVVTSGFRIELLNKREV